jgi:ABC-type phosphate transport system substrate-binding protein
LAGISEDQSENYDFDFTVTPLCKDAFVFIVPVDNRVDSLSIDDLNEIYSGKSQNNWQVYGGDDMGINNTAPTTINIVNGSYPFIKEFVAVSRDDSDNPNVQILIDWLRGPQGQELAEKTGYVPINFPS